MTHTPGFEEQIKDLFNTDASKLNLSEYLKTHIPARIYPPGTVPAYSNYGASLAGYIVERVSGTPFDRYVEDHILTPLGMTHSTLRQPLPDALKAQMSSGYNLASGTASEFEVVNAYPAGSMSAPATFTEPFTLPGEHFFFVPQVELSNGDFYWLSASRPITAPGTPFAPDLQAWTRDENLDPDWSRVGTDIVGGATPPTFNAAFSLSGVTSPVPEPSTYGLVGAVVLAGLIVTRRKIRNKR